MAVSDELLDELLSKPVGPANFSNHKDSIGPEDFTSRIQVNGNILTAELRDQRGVIDEGRAIRYIEDEGQDPAKWEVASWYKVEYGPIDPHTDKPSMESVKFTFRKRTEGLSEVSVDPEEAKALLETYSPVYKRPDGSWGFLVLIGDMQFGKMDGDGPAGSLRRTIDCLKAAADEFLVYSQIYDIGHIHVAWLGDHVEGFQSQGGSNAWRTVLTLNEQIRLTHRVMLFATKLFAPMAERVTFAAVPGNHGEAVRFDNKGITRFDDSHDTEQLVSIATTIDELEVPGFEHVDFYVPDTDELIVLSEVAGTNIAHHHGHLFGTKKDAVFDWWQKQAFNRQSAMYDADLLVAGHLHHEHTEADGDRLFIQTGAMESESTYFRHSKGTTGNPCLTIALTKDGQTPVRHTIYAERSV